MKQTNIIIRLLFFCFAFMLLAVLVAGSTGLQAEETHFTFSGLFEYMSDFDTVKWYVPYRDYLNTLMDRGFITGVGAGVFRGLLAFFIEPINAVLWGTSNIINVIRFITQILGYMLLTV